MLLRSSNPSNKAINRQPSIYAGGESDDSPQTRTTRIVAGGLAAWRNGNYRQAIKRLYEWPYRSPHAGR